jgi:XTP/dITP diphosphohydrolase
MMKKGSRLPKTLVVATRNPHKAAEIAAAITGPWIIKTLADYPALPEIPETGSTFLVNATIKAVGISQLLNELILADDSGIEVDALGGAPGVYSARYAGEGSTDVANNEKLLRELEKAGALSPMGRRARYRCVLVLAQNGKAIADFTGGCSGTLLNEARGANGFGYDPLFVPDGHTQSFGELDSSVKAAISHRARALIELQKGLNNYSSNASNNI